MKYGRKWKVLDKNILYLRDIDEYHFYEKVYTHGSDFLVFTDQEGFLNVFSFKRKEIKKFDNIKPKEIACSEDYVFFYIDQDDNLYRLDYDSGKDHGFVFPRVKMLSAGSHEIAFVDFNGTLYYKKIDDCLHKILYTSNVIDLACGDDFVIFIDEEHYLWVFGDNTDGKFFLEPRERIDANSVRLPIIASKVVVTDSNEINFCDLEGEYWYIMSSKGIIQA